MDTQTGGGASGTHGDGEGAFRAASVQAGICVSLPYETVEGKITHASGGVRVERIRGSDTRTIDTNANAWGWFSADFTSIGQDIQSGDSVRVTDLTDMQSSTVDCTLTATVNVAADTVSGNAASGNGVDVYLKAPSTYYGDIPPGAAHRQVTAGGGSYNASFTGTNIRDGDAAYVFSTDASGHVVMEVARTAGTLVVYPQYDEVMGFHQPSVSVTVAVGSDTRTVGTSATGFFDALFTTHDIVPSDVVSANLGGARSITVADVSATADPLNDVVQGSAPPNRPIRITMNAYRQPLMVETTSGPDGFFSYDFTGKYTVSGIEVFNVAWYNDAGDCVVYEFQTYSWFLPEGYTGQGFDEWVLIMNPGQDAVWVRVLYQTLVGQVEGPLIRAMPGTRVSVHVNDWARNHHVSTMVTAIDGGEIMAERSMYMYRTVDGKWGAHDSIGIIIPSPVWYLPEGATYRGFDEWVLVQNPNDVQVLVKVQFLAQGGVAKELYVNVEKRSRFTIHVNDHVPNMEIATRVECLTSVGGEVLPVFSERAMYMNTPDGKRGAHDSIGSSTLAPEWYLPEGTTRPGFDEWVTVMNPNSAGTNVRVTFLTPAGVADTVTFYMHPNSRGTVHVNDHVPNQDVATVVTSLEGYGILAERPMYVNTPDGKRGAHVSIGAFSPATSWYLPEGTTRPGFDQWIMVLNPNDTQAQVRITLLGPGGPVAQTTFTMGPRSRASVHVNEMIRNTDVSSLVESVGSAPVGILAERAMYMWTSDNKQGSHCSIGIPTL